MEACCVFQSIIAVSSPLFSSIPNPKQASNRNGGIHKLRCVAKKINTTSISGEFHNDCVSSNQSPVSRIDRQSTILQIQESSDLSSALARHGEMLNVQDINVILRYFGKLNRRQELYQKVFAILEVGRLAVFYSILDRFAGLKVFHWMRQNQKINVASYSSYVKFMGKSLSCVEAIEIYSSIKDRSIKFNVSVCNAFLSSLVKNGKSESSLKLFTQMKQGGLVPDVVTYSTLLAGCAKVKDGYCKALELVQELTSNGLQMDSVTYGSLLSVCASHKEFNEAAKYFQKMKDEGHSPNVYHYSSLLNAYSADGNCEKAEALIEEMRSAGLVLNKVIYTTLLKVYVKRGLFEKSKELLKELEALGYAKDEWVVPGHLIQALQLAGTEDKEEIVIDIETIPLCKLWTVWLARNCRCFERKEQNVAFMKCRFFQYLKLLWKMPFCLLMDGLAKSGHLLEAKSVFDEMMKKQVKTDSVSWCFQVKIHKMSFGYNIFGSKNTGIGSSSPMITSEPLMGSSNHLAWTSSVELSCKGQGAQDHLKINASAVDEKAKSTSVARPDASVAGFSFACVSQSSTLGSWVVDSGPQYGTGDWHMTLITRPLPSYIFKFLHNMLRNITDPPYLIHKHLGHSNLSKLHKMMPGLSSLATLDYLRSTVDTSVKPRPFTRSQAKELQQFQSLFMHLKACESVMHPDQGRVLLTMESEGSSSQSLGNDAIGTLMARLEAIARKMDDNQDAIKGDMDSWRSEMASLTGGVIRMKARVDRFYPPKPPQNSNHQVPNPLDQRPYTPRNPMPQIQTHHQPNLVPLLHTFLNRTQSIQVGEMGELAPKESEAKPQDGEKMNGEVQGGCEKKVKRKGKPWVVKLEGERNA
ncbi:Pentatricopeptide repeat-containing protein, chloroplastic [Capsicum annuum]|nr:Pentatricopeptide repeat-containing protein, chloroplastic [Capsicum annuum]